MEQKTSEVFELKKNQIPKGITKKFDFSSRNWEIMAKKYAKIKFKKKIGAKLSKFFLKNRQNIKKKI